VPRDVLHGDVVDPAPRPIHVVDGDDGRMGELPRRAPRVEALDELLLGFGTVADVAPQRLQHDDPIDARIASLVDKAHGALADLLEDLVATEA